MKKIAFVHFNHTLKDGLVVWPDMRTSRWKPNYGDMLVCSSLLKQVDSHGLVHERAAFGQEVSDDVDIAIIRGSTYIHHNFDFDKAIKTLDSIKSPVAIIGLGAQNSTKDISFLDSHKKAHEFIQKLSEKSKSISVRGEFTAEVLRRHGADNIRITGCPSVFYKLQCPQVSVSPMLASPQRRLGVSLHTGLMKNIFCRAPVAAKELHGQLINYCIRNASSVSLFEQGVKSEFDIADTMLPFQERLAAAKTVTERVGANHYLTSEDLIARMVSVRSIEEWLAKARDLDSIMGFRFHGNMVALLQGLPCLYYVYDSRLQEFCELYNLPWIDVESDWKDPVETILNFDWSKTNKSLMNCFNEMKEFYDENGITHCLR